MGPRSRMRPCGTSLMSHKNSLRPFEMRWLADGLSEGAGPGFDGATPAAEPPGRVLAIQFIGLSIRSLRRPFRVGESQNPEQRWQSRTGAEDSPESFPLSRANAPHRQFQCVA